MKHPKYTEDEISRFWSKVDTSGDCWEWTASLNPNGYGMIQIRRVQKGPIIASRMSYEMHYGEIPNGMLVCHTCDNRRCVNPAHLFLGDHTANAADMMNKGRGRNGNLRGSKVGTALLTEVKVRQIRALYDSGQATMYELADRFGVKYVTIWTVVRRTSWKHVD